MHSLVLALLLITACSTDPSGDVPHLCGTRRPPTCDHHDHAPITGLFNQGLRLTYAFNHAEVIRSHEQALKPDPGCAMWQSPSPPARSCRGLARGPKHLKCPSPVLVREYTFLPVAPPLPISPPPRSLRYYHTEQAPRHPTQIVPWGKSSSDTNRSRP